jgi:prepilin-type N-terminal cleavage/methylation domain-containing protein
MKSKIRNRKSKIRAGLTLVELMITMFISLIILLAASIPLVNSQKAWNSMYNDIYSQAANESLIAVKRFDRVVRNASSTNISIDPAGCWVEVYYYSGSSATTPDRYARFYRQNSELVLDCGIRTPKQTLTLQTLCQNVSNCKFRAVGTSVQMFLTLNNGNKEITVASSALMNNQ